MARSVRGYSGWYKGVYLRSSLEFAYAYYLDKIGVKWIYEKQLYHIGTFTYKPDFFLYDDRGNLFKIVEVKGEGNFKRGVEKVQIFMSENDIPIEILTYAEIRRLYQNEMPMRLHAVKRMWIEKFGASLEDNYMTGDANPRFGAILTTETKRKISEKAKQRAKEGHHNAQRLIEYNRENDWEAMRKPRSERVERQCNFCGSSITVTTYSKRKYCTHLCAVRASSPKGASRLKNQAKKRRDLVKAFILAWVEENKEIILSTPSNKITTTLDALFSEIEKRFGIKDLRIISKAVFGEDRGRKELLYYLQQIASQNVCRTHRRL